MKENPSYYAIIPASVRYDKTIPAGAKLLYGEITALSNQKGYCFASNTYFSNLYACTPQAISKWIKALETAGHVRIEYHGNAGQQERRVSILVNTYQHTLRGVSTVVEGVSTVVEHNNTRVIVQEEYTHTQSEKSENELPTDYQGTYTHLITYLKANPHFIDSLKSRSGFTGQIAPILQDYLCKMQERGEWYQLRIPTDAADHQRWIAKILAGVEGWAKVRKNNPRRKPAAGETVYEAPKNVYKPIRP